MTLNMSFEFIIASLLSYFQFEYLIVDIIVKYINSKKRGYVNELFWE